MASVSTTLATARNGTAPTTTPPRPRIHRDLTLCSERQARELLSCPYPQQRPLRPYHVEYLRYLIRVGHLRQGTEVTLAQIDDVRYLVNGQHTLTALLWEKRPTWLTITTHTCQTMQEVATLYQSFDRGLQRSLADLYDSQDTFTEAQWSRRQILKLGSAIAPLALGFQTEPRLRRVRSRMLRDAGLRLALMSNWLPEAENAYRGLFGHHLLSTALLHAPVLSLILVTYRYQAERAHLFWPRLASNSGLLEGDPAHTLVNWLLTTPVRKMEPLFYSRHVATCWNADFERRQLYRITPRALVNPIRIAGTPHDGNAVYVYLSLAGEVLQEPQAQGERVGLEEEEATL